jgi:hypothetical protein
MRGMIYEIVYLAKHAKGALKDKAQTAKKLLDTGEYDKEEKQQVLKPKKHSIILRLNQEMYMTLTWYTVTFLLKCKVDEIIETPVTCFEQIHLLKAKDPNSAYEKAIKLGKSKEHYYKNNEGNNVYWEFVGLINLEEILDERIHDGIEIRSRRLFIDNPEKLIRDKDGLTIFISERIGKKTAEEIISEL